MKERQVYQFGEFSLDATAKVVFREGHPVALTRKAVETLLVLVENPGQVLTKGEIITAVWQDRIVDEANLAQNIAVVRKALNAPPGNPAHIETFPGRGYRLEGPVTTTVVHATHPEVHPPAITEEEHPAAAESVSVRPRAPWRLAAGAAALLAISAALIWSALREDGDSGNRSFHVSAVTRLPGSEYQPAVSPDGSMVAFLWAKDGARTPGVWVRARGEDSERALTTEPGTFSSPCWSLDGKRLAYLRIEKESMGIIIRGIDGGAESRVATLAGASYGFENRLLAWSPDGTQMVVSHAETPVKPRRLILVDVATGTMRDATNPATGFPGDLDPRFSPDGESITFVRAFHRAQHDLFLIPAKGGAERRLTEFGRQISSHDWARNGKSIVAGSDRTGEFRVWVIPVSGRREPSPVGIYGDFPIQLSVAHQAPVLVYSVLHQDRNIWRLDLGTLEWQRVIASTAQDASPQYSPDGKRICFRSDRSGEEQLWVSDADGSNAMQVTQIKESPSVGKWSPKGNAVVFNAPVTGAIYIASEGPPGRWTTRELKATGVHPVFSPDGQWIYAGGPQIVKIPATGGEPSVVFKTTGLSLEVAPGGEDLYFVREPSDSSLSRGSLRTGEVVKVLDGLVPGCTSCWAATPEGIYYLGADKESFDRQVLYWHDLRTGKARAILRYPEPLWPFGSGPFSLSPDGRGLLCVRVEAPNSDVMRVEPFE